MFKQLLIKLLICLFATIYSSPISGQNFIFKNFTTEEGLINNTVFQVYEDSQGYIWLAADRGISKYNGYEFESFTLNDNLPGLTIFGFFEDSKQRLWLRTHNGKSGFYYKGTFFQTNLPEEYISNHIVAYHELPNDTISIKYVNGMVVKFKLNEHHQVIDSSISSLNIRKNNHHTSLFGILENFPNNKEYTQMKEYFNSSFEAGPIQFRSYDSTLAFAYVKNLFISSDQFKTFKEINYEHDINYIYQSPYDGSIYINFFNNGYIKYKDITLSEVIEEKNNLGRITSIMIDRFNGLWITTLDNGIYYTANTDIEHLSEKFKTESITYIEGLGKKIYFATDSDSIFTKKGSHTAHFFSSIHPQNSEVKQLDKIHNHIYISNSNGWIIDSNETISNIGIGREFYPDGETGLWTTYGAGELFSYSFNGSSYVKTNTYRSPKKTKAKRLIKYGDSLLISTLRGVEFFNQKTRQFEKNKWGERFSCLEKTKNILFLGTFNKGLLVGNTDRIDTINVKKGLLSNSINKIHIQNDSTIWLATNKGINRLTISSYVPLQYKISEVTKIDGLSSSIIFDIYTYNDTIYAATNKGINVLSTHLANHKYQPLIRLESLKINKRDTLIKHAYELSYQNNDIEINFVGLLYSAQGNISYKYRLLGKIDNWNTTKNRSIRFIDLTSGDYIFQVKAVGPTGIESSTISEIKLSILPPFWATWWFLTLMVLLAIGGVFILIQKRLNQIRKKSELKSELYRLEHKALNAQMNPHFIFNALTSIQHYIIKKDKYEAYNYLNRFATLMRSILKNSEDERVTLSEEIELLEHYLELEQIRFDNNFNYTITVSENLDIENIEIPAMLIQPYVENAIRHGFLHKEGKGILAINLSEKEQKLNCIIEDNGVGREKAQQLKKDKNRVSYAMNINQRRVSLINQLNQQKASITIEDLYENGIACGTRVTLMTPIKPID